MIWKLIATAAAVVAIVLGVSTVDKNTNGWISSHVIYLGNDPSPTLGATPEASLQSIWWEFKNCMEGESGGSLYSGGVRRQGEPTSGPSWAGGTYGIARHDCETQRDTHLRESKLSQAELDAWDKAHPLGN